MYSLVIPVYMNEASIPTLLEAVEDLNQQLDGQLEAVFVIDGSPDRSLEALESELPSCRFDAQLIVLSRNFGSFAAIRAGLGEARGNYFAVMAADLQEPPELVIDFFRSLESEPIDITIGTRRERDDPLLSQWSARAFWFVYRRFIQSEMPPGGVDVFACNREVRDRLLELEESNSSLVGLLFWIGFRRKLIPYRRRLRGHGQSAWTWSRKLRYLSDSVFAFSDFPIRVLKIAGALGMAASMLFGVVALAVRVAGLRPVPGYTAIVVAITFFAGLNMFGLGVIGSYVWRAFENTKRRPSTIVMARKQFERKSERDQ